jgi:hypothetical protein
MNHDTHHELHVGLLKKRWGYSRPAPRTPPKCMMPS